MEVENDNMEMDKNHLMVDKNGADPDLGDAAVALHLEDPFLLEVLKNLTTLKDQTFALHDAVDVVRKAGAEAGADKDKPIELPEDVLDVQKSLLNHLGTLRGQNRKLAYSVRDTKATTAKSRAEVDTLHLQLQNLYYEERHLRGEISNCQNYQHPYKDLPLISEEEFLAKFPEWATKKDEENSDTSGPHGLMLARIVDEKNTREELEAQRKALVNRKMELVKENSRRKDELVKLDRDLEAFIEAAKPIQKTFEKDAPP